jgi:hypothetical protein
VMNRKLSIPVTARCKAWVNGSLLAGTAVSNPAGGGAWIFVSCVYVFSGRGLCDGPILRPEESD